MSTSLSSSPRIRARLRNGHLGTEYLAVFETNHRTPYFFNLHHGDIAHAILVGATGSGKSFTLAFLLSHLQKFAPFTYIFDLGPSYRELTQRFRRNLCPVWRQ